MRIDTKSQQRSLTMIKYRDIITLRSTSGIFITKTRALSMCRKLNRLLIATERSPLFLEVKYV